MSTISNTASNFSANLLAQQFAHAATYKVLNKDQSQPAPISSTASKSDILSAQTTELMKRMSEARQAIAKLGSATQEISQARKAFAAEILKRIKEQIKMMMLMTAGDPKARARQIAALARELAAAAQEYAAASGSTSQTSEASTANSVSSQNEATSSVEQSNSTNSATSTATSTAEVATQPDQNAGTIAPDAAPTATANPAEPTQSQPTTTHQIFEQLANKLSAYSQTSSASKEDQEFAMEVKRLAAQLKALAKQNEMRPHKGSDQSIGRENADTSEALREVEHSVAIIESANVSYTPIIHIVAN